MAYRSVEFLRMRCYGIRTIKAVYDPACIFPILNITVEKISKFPTCKAAFFHTKKHNF